MTFYFKFVNGSTVEDMARVAGTIKKLKGVFGVAPMFPKHSHPRMRTMYRIEANNRTHIDNAVVAIRKLDGIEYAEAPVIKNNLVRGEDGRQQEC
jgi:hypothetical protein